VQVSAHDNWFRTGVSGPVLTLLSARMGSWHGDMQGDRKCLRLPKLQSGCCEMMQEGS